MLRLYNSPAHSVPSGTCPVFAYTCTCETECIIYKKLVTKLDKFQLKQDVTLLNVLSTRGKILK